MTLDVWAGRSPLSPEARPAAAAAAEKSRYLFSFIRPGRFSRPPEKFSSLFSLSGRAGTHFLGLSMWKNLTEVRSMRHRAG